MDGSRERVDPAPGRAGSREIVKRDISRDPRRGVGEALIGDTSDGLARRWERRANYTAGVV